MVALRRLSLLFIFLLAEDGIRVTSVTGVQTCALPICASVHAAVGDLSFPAGIRPHSPRRSQTVGLQIGRASCRERMEMAGTGLHVEKYMAWNHDIHDNLLSLFRIDTTSSSNKRTHTVD